MRCLRCYLLVQLTYFDAQGFMNKTSFAAAVSMAALCLGAPIFAQDKTAEIDQIFSWATRETPGCTVAVSHNGKLVANRAYGSADLERGLPITTNSVFDAGSVVKQFVAASVLLLVEEGKLSLTEDVRKYIPELPDTGHKVTVDHLLTHTSGIRDWTGIRPLAEGDPDVLTLILRQRALNFAPGEEWSYSNSGYELLKEIVARVSGMSFADFTRKRLFEPLGMKSSRYIVKMTEGVPRRALAYKKDKDAWKLDMYLGHDRGGGALLITATDLVLWSDALAANRLGAFVTQKLHEPAKLNNGRKLSYARGLFLETFRDGSPLVWHSGGAAGYSTIVARLPEHGISLALMCNQDEGARSADTRRVFDLLVPPGSGKSAADAQAANARGAAVAVGDQSSRAGLYFNEQTRQPLRLAANNSTLAIVGSGPLVALAPDRFRNQRASLRFMSEAEFEMRFLSADQFEMKTREGEITRYRRAKPYAPTPAELQAFAGRYRSDEIGAFLDLTTSNSGLSGRANNASGEALEFKPVDRDTFQLAGVSLRFRRDQAGKVVALDFSNPVVRNINFTKK
jgi:CubicO group peptidase (beta-lactamase class C family)